MAQQVPDEGHTMAYACHPQMAPALERAGLEGLDGFRWGGRLFAAQHVQATPQHRRLGIVRSRAGWPASVDVHDLDRAVADLVSSGGAAA